MSATIRHDIGLQVEAAINEADPFILAKLKSKRVSRYAGIYHNRWECCSFSLKLPTGVGEAWNLMEACWRVKRASNAPVTAKDGCGLVARKIATSLGLPTGPVGQAEAGFLQALSLDPRELTAWAAYADWLEERSEERSAVIRDWMGKKAVECRGGVISRVRETYKKVPYNLSFLTDLFNLSVPNLFEDIP